MAGNADNMAIRLSIWLNAWGAITGVGIIALVSVITYGKVSWTGHARRALLFFDTEARYQVGIRFCSLAEMLSRNGASHLEILDAAQSVMGSRFTQHHIKSARTAMNVHGMAFEEAIGGGLLTAQHAELLSSMAPGGRRDLYAQAFRTVGLVQKRILETRYLVAEGMFRAFLLLSIMLLLITMGKGMYDDAHQYNLKHLHIYTFTHNEEIKMEEQLTMGREEGLTLPEMLVWLGVFAVVGTRSLPCRAGASFLAPVSSRRTRKCKA